jgi:hypothetical protein
MSGIKITAADKWFSLCVRCRDNWTDQWKGTRFPAYVEGGDNRALQGLHDAHCFSRGSHMTRFELDNSCALSYGSHSYLDSHPEEKKKFFLKRLGQERYDELERLSKIPYKGFKKDQKMLSAKFRALFRQMLKDKRKATFYNAL